MRKISLILFIGCIFVNITGFSPDRDSWQQPDRIMDSTGVQPGMVIGEIGAGRGYFTFKLSERDPDKWTHGRGHFWPEEKIIDLIEEAGYSVTKIMRYLPKDYIFECIPGDAE